MTYGETVEMTPIELRNHPEVEFCACGKPYALHKAGDHAFEATGRRHPRSLVSLPIAKSSGVFVGIDPGTTGAVVIIEGDELEFHDTPVSRADNGRMVIDPELCASLLLDLPSDALITIERQWARSPIMSGKDGKQGGNGNVSSFGIGYSFGIWRGVMGTLKIKPVLVTPQAWKKAMIPSDIEKGKDASRTVARRLWPDQTEEALSRKKDHGRADAALIAEYGRRTAR